MTSTISTFYTLPNDNETKQFLNKHKEYTLDKLTKSANKKQNIINEQINSFGLYLHKGKNSEFKNSFYLNNYITYNDVIIKSFEEFKNIITLENITEFNYSEHLYLNESRIFFDVDFKNTTEQPQLEQLFNAIQLFSIKHKLNIYGIIEIQNEDDEELIDLCSVLESNPENHIEVVINENQTKKLSSHIFLNGYSNRKDIENYMKNYFLKEYNINNCSLFDTSVYKSTKQALRCSFSDKVDQKEKTIRLLPLDIKKTLIENNIDLLYQLRMAPLKTDKYIDLKHDVINNKQHNTIVNNTQNNNKKNEVSIFQFVKNPYGDNLINLYDIYTSTNHFEFSKLLLPYVSCVLDEDEIIEEIKNISVPNTTPETFIPFEDWIELVINDLKNNIKQDPTNIKTLFTLKKYNKDMFENCKINLNDEELIAFKRRRNLLNYYITKYEKLNFVSHEFYDINDKAHRDEQKKYRVLYNCYTILNDEAIYCPYDNTVFKNKTQLRTTLKMSGATIDELQTSLICFNSHMEFNKLRIEYEVKYKLTLSQRKTYLSYLNKFMTIFRTGFKFEDDYNYYLSFLAAKLTTERTINKGLINQGTETDPAINSFKTLFTDLLKDYISTTTADYKNVNKKLNGTYFMNKLLIIEELPKIIDDMDNLINTLKINSNTDILTIEEKGEKPRQIKNMCDYIINTNNTVKSMFKNYNDCVSLLKRFRIITRQSIKMTEEVNQTLDFIKENKQMFSYFLKEYLINDVKSDYFKQHKNEYNDVMNLYVSATSYSNETNKISVKFSLEEFINTVKTEYVDTKNRLRLTKFYEYLVELKAINKINVRTFKQNIIILLNEHVKILNNGKTIKLDEEAYKIIYDQYFEFDDEEDEKNENDEK